MKTVGGIDFFLYFCGGNEAFLAAFSAMPLRSTKAWSNLDEYPIAIFLLQRRVMKTK